MRILVATHNYPRFEGDPAGAFVATLARAVGQAGHQVTVLAPHAPQTPLHEHNDAVIVRRFRYAPSAWERVGYRGDLHRQPLLSPVTVLGVPALVAAFRRALHRAAAEFAPDVVHAHWWLPAGWLATGQPAPVVITCHGSDVRLLERSRLLRALARRALGRAAAITTVSRFLARDLERLLPDLATAVDVVYMPLDVARFATGRAISKADPPIVLYAGNLLASKGVADLLDAADLLRRRGVRFAVKILGEGPERDALRERATRLGIAPLITWSDFVSQHDMPEEYGRSTVAVLPTRGHAEGLGLMLAEALLAGCAVVGTAAGGKPEVVVHDQTGLLARAGDAEDLAHQIGRLLADRGLRERLSAAGAARVQHLFAPERAVARFLSVFGAVSQRHRAA